MEVPSPAGPASASAPAAASAAVDWQLPTHLTTYSAVTANVSVVPTNKQPKWVEYDKKVGDGAA